MGKVCKLYAFLHFFALEKEVWRKMSCRRRFSNLFLFVFFWLELIVQEREKKVKIVVLEEVVK